MKINLLIFVIILLIFLPTIVLAQNFRDKVIISPDITFLWNFQRGFEDFVRFFKFFSKSKIEYSLDLADRRIGEIQTLEDKNKTDMIEVVELEYEREIGRIEAILNRTSISEEFKGMIIKRLQDQVKVLGDVMEKTPDNLKEKIFSAAKKASECIEIVSKK
jgi:ribosomal protein L15